MDTDCTVCAVCDKVKSKLKVKKCKCGKVPHVAHFNIMIEWHVYCECGREVDGYPAYEAAVKAWNKLNTTKR